MLREKCILMNLDNVELFSQMTKKKPTRHLVTMKFSKTLNPTNTMNIPQNLEHELTKRGAYAIYMFNANHLFKVVFLLFFFF